MVWIHALDTGYTEYIFAKDAHTTPSYSHSFK